MGAESTRPPLTLDEFRGLLARELEIPEELVAPAASFLDDLQADSVQLVDLFLRFEGMGISIPLDAAWRIRTVQDAYDLYVESVQAPGVPVGA